MAIPNKQIGWSQKSNLLWEISRELDKTLIAMRIQGIPTTTTTTTICFNCIEAPVIIGTQTWDKCNLDVTTYANGDPIPEVTDGAVWNTLTTGAWCYYENNPANGPIYGKIYNWYAVNDIRGLAPVGKHIPSDTEWTTLTDYLGGLTVAGGKLKETGFCHWLSPNTGATNESAFTAFAGGYFNGVNSFANINANGFWWSSTENFPSTAWNVILDTSVSDITRTSSPKKSGYSVRCLLD